MTRRRVGTHSSDFCNSCCLAATCRCPWSRPTRHRRTVRPGPKDTGSRERTSPDGTLAVLAVERIRDRPAIFATRRRFRPERGISRHICRKPSGAATPASGATGLRGRDRSGNGAAVDHRAADRTHAGGSQTPRAVLELMTPGDRTAAGDAGCAHRSAGRIDDRAPGS